MSGDFEKELSDAIKEVFAWNNDFSKGIGNTLVGRTVTEASADVWSSAGEWSIHLTFDDGSTIESTATLASGPLADIIRMGGGDPDPID